MLYQRSGEWVGAYTCTVQVLAANLCVWLMCEPCQYEIIPVNLPTTVSLNLSHRVFSTPLDVLNVRLDYALKHVVGQITFTTMYSLT